MSRLRGDLYEAIVGQDVAFFDRSRTGELTNRLASDTTVLQNAVTVNLSMALRFGFGAAGGAAMLVWMSPILALVGLGTVPVVVLGAALYGRFLRGIYAWVGFRQVQLPYEEAERAGGDTHYSTFDMLVFALRAVLSFSHLPLPPGVPTDPER